MPQPYLSVVVETCDSKVQLLALGLFTKRCEIEHDAGAIIRFVRELARWVVAATGYNTTSAHIQRRFEALISNHVESL